MYASKYTYTVYMQCSCICIFIYLYTYCALVRQSTSHGVFTCLKHIIFMMHDVVRKPFEVHDMLYAAWFVVYLIKEYSRSYFQGFLPNAYVGICGIFSCLLFLRKNTARKFPESTHYVYTTIKLTKMIV